MPFYKKHGRQSESWHRTHGTLLSVQPLWNIQAVDQWQTKIEATRKLKYLQLIVPGTVQFALIRSVKVLLQSTVKKNCAWNQKLNSLWPLFRYLFLFVAGSCTIERGSVAEDVCHTHYGHHKELQHLWLIKVKREEWKKMKQGVTLEDKILDDVPECDRWNSSSSSNRSEGPGKYRAYLRSKEYPATC